MEHLRQDKKSIFYKTGRVRNSYHSEYINADTIFKYLKLIDEKEANIKAIYNFSNKEYNILKNIYIISILNLLLMINFLK
jgi:hypothetical protein